MAEGSKESVESKRFPREWVEKAEVFIREAERHLEQGVYWLACFEAQQAAEFYLKALIIKLTATHPYTNDITELLEVARELGLNVPENALTPHYTPARYPGRKPLEYNKDRAKRCVSQAKSIIDWVLSHDP